MNLARRILVVILGAALLVTLVGTSCAQLQRIKSSIAGTVYMDGRPQAFGTVQALNEAGQVVAQERCGDGGHFQLKDLDPGTYTLVWINNMGVPYGGGTVVQVRRGRFEQVNLELSAADRVQMGGN